ncbi:hypothetical protein KUCAC02_036586 [Chaenocephalus aceratus]|nr:hypothetical protein KUCAC02_036586 [Chaenocephalus aceratus]
MELDDYSVYNQLSDEELLQIAVERSLSDLSTASSLPPATPPPPSPPHASSGVNPPRAVSNFPYRAFRRELSPLQTLIMNAEADALMGLVRRRSSSLTEQSDEGWIALHEAALYGQLQGVSVLVSGEAFCSCFSRLSEPMQSEDRPKHRQQGRETTLFIACEKPNEAVEDLLLRGGAEGNRSNAQGASALHEVCMNGQLKLCRMLLESGAHLQSKDVYGIRPLFIAARHGHDDILLLLAKRGADVDGQAADGASPLKADANRSTKSGCCLFTLLLSKVKQVCWSLCSLTDVSLLIQVTGTVRVQRSGISPLHIAAEKNQDEIMRLLINMNLEAARRCWRPEPTQPGCVQPAAHRCAAGPDRYGCTAAEVRRQRQRSDPHPAVLLRMESLPMLKLLLDNGCDAGCCFDCPYGQKPHLAVRLSQRGNAEARQVGVVLIVWKQSKTFIVKATKPPVVFSTGTRTIEPAFCEATSCLTVCHVAGPIISLLLDYVGHVRLCSRLIEVLEIHSDWAPIKLKAVSPRPLMQL